MYSQGVNTAGNGDGERGDRAFQRRIRKRVKAKEHRIILKLPPFFASVGLRELEARIGCQKAEQSDRGIELSGSIDLIYRLHLELQIPSRVMIEIGRFRAGATEELFKRSAELPWELWINPALPMKVESRVYRSRIQHEGAAGETLFKGIRRRFERTMPGQRLREAGEAPFQRIVLAIEQNQASILIDTSGEHLHKRGYRICGGDAPIRETSAAAFLFWLLQRIDPPQGILDPMCGSGTLAIEAGLYTSRHSLHREEQLRSFLFEELPWHRPAAWEYRKKQAQEAIIPDTPIIASDIRPEALEMVENNLSRIAEQPDIALETGDFFQRRATDYPSIRHGLLVCNLPYGVRRQEGNSRFAARFFRHARRNFPNWDIGCILPADLPGRSFQRRPTASDSSTEASQSRG